jgi:hypothetical protein
MNEVLIVLPVYEPQLPFLNEQIKSLQSQSFRDFTCVVSYDGPKSHEFIEYLEKACLDSRFITTSFDIRAGVYRHIERLMESRNNQFKFIFLCDQDDLWDKNKLANQVARLKSGFILVSDNARLVDEHGKLIKNKSLFGWLAINKKSARYSLIANCATGAGTGFASEILDFALPFPKSLGNAFHDHWLMLVAQSLGECLLQTSCSWSYRQHSTNIVGAFSSGRSGSRFALVFAKVLEILRHRYQQPKEKDLKWLQILEFERELRRRDIANGNRLIRPSEYSRWPKKIILLFPHHLFRSRLETLRVFCSL